MGLFKQNKKAVLVNKCSTLKPVPGNLDVHFTIHGALRVEIKSMLLNIFEMMIQIFSNFYDFKEKLFVADFIWW